MKIGLLFLVGTFTQVHPHYGVYYLQSRIVAHLKKNKPIH